MFFLSHSLKALELFSTPQDSNPLHFISKTKLPTPQPKSKNRFEESIYLAIKFNFLLSINFEAREYAKEKSEDPLLCDKYSLEL